MCFTPIEPSDTLDQTDALQAALNDSLPVYLKPGVYCHRPLTGVAGHILRGSGIGTTLKQIGAGVGLTLASDMLIENIRFQAAVTSATGAIQGTNVKMVTLRKVYTDGLTMGIGEFYTEAAIKLVSSGGDNSYGVALEGVVLQHGRGDGLQIVGGCAGVYLRGGHIQANDGFGIYAAAPGGVELSLWDVVIEGNILGGVYIDNWYSSEATGCHFENSAGQSTPLMRLGLGGACKALSIRNNSFGGVAADYAIDVSGGGANIGIAIDSNTFAGVAKSPVYVYKLFDSSIMGNVFNGAHVAYKQWSQCKNLLIHDKDGIRFISTGEMPAPLPIYVGMLIPLL